MWVIFILSCVIIALIAVPLVLLAAWLIHKVSNAMICDDLELKREIDEENKLYERGE